MDEGLLPNIITFLQAFDANLIQELSYKKQCRRMAKP